jgi:AcrR family transcriptional regulator
MHRRVASNFVQAGDYVALEHWVSTPNRGPGVGVFFTVEQSGCSRQRLSGGFAAKGGGRNLHSGMVADPFGFPSLAVRAEVAVLILDRQIDGSGDWGPVPLEGREEHRPRAVERLQSRFGGGHGETPFLGECPLSAEREYSLSMVEGNLTPAAERLLDAAMRLFAEKGYERTTVGEIQEAAGLTFGSGALYKHFPTKEALLAAGVDRFVEAARSERRMLTGLDDEPLVDALHAIGRLAMSAFEREKDALRIAWRDLENFPDLQEKVRSDRIRATFDDFSSWLRRQADMGRLVLDDSQAVAAVALSSLAFFQLLKHLLHDTPGGISEERFIDAWTTMIAKVTA